MILYMYYNSLILINVLYKSKTFELLELLDIVGFIVGIVYGPKWPFYLCCDYIGLFGTGFIHVLYLGRAPRTKETLPDFLEKCRVTRHLRVFRGLTGSQRTPRFWGVTMTLRRTPPTMMIAFFTHNHKTHNLEHHHLTHVLVY